MMQQGPHPIGRKVGRAPTEAGKPVAQCHAFAYMLICRMLHLLTGRTSPRMRKGLFFPVFMLLSLPGCTGLNLGLTEAIPDSIGAGS